jgi:hypothetical protein
MYQRTAAYPLLPRLIPINPGGSLCGPRPTDRSPLVLNKAVLGWSFRLFVYIRRCLSCSTAHSVVTTPCKSPTKCSSLLSILAICSPALRSPAIARAACSELVSTGIYLPDICLTPLCTFEVATTLSLAHLLMDILHYLGHLCLEYI